MNKLCTIALVAMVPELSIYGQGSIPESPLPQAGAGTHAPAPSAETALQNLSSDSLRQGKGARPPDFVQVDSEPVIKKRKEPYYPELAQKAGVEGNVWVKMWVDAEGKVQEAEILQSNNEVFNQPALEAASQWEFEPAKVKGKPIAVWVTIPFAFRIGGSETKKGKEESAFSSLIQQTKEILQGKNLAAASEAIDESANLIDGMRSLKLLEAITHWGTPAGFPDERDRPTVQLTLKTGDAGDMIVMALKTESPQQAVPRFHSVVWKRWKKGAWKIIHWHTSQ